MTSDRVVVTAVALVVFLVVAFAGALYVASR